MISIVADPSGQTSTYDVNVTIPSLPNDSSFTLSVQEVNNPSIGATATGVFDPISTTPATPLATTEGVATQFNLGTVQDQLFNFATINWEDGSQPQVLPLNSSDQLIGTHTYDAGNYNPVITVTNTLGTYTIQDSIAVNSSRYRRAGSECII